MAELPKLLLLLLNHKSAYDFYELPYKDLDKPSKSITASVQCRTQYQRHWSQCKHNRIAGTQHLKRYSRSPASKARSMSMNYSIQDNHKSTSDSIAFTIGGTEVKARVMIPNKLIDRLDSAAALGSETSSNAVAIAEELAPSVTPLVT